MKHILTACIFVIGSFAYGQLKTESVLKQDDLEKPLNTMVYSLGKRGLLLQSKETVGKKGELSYYSTDLDKLGTVPFDIEPYTTDLGLFADEDSVVFSFLSYSTSYWIVREFNTETRKMERRQYPKSERYFIPEDCISFKDKLVLRGAVNDRPSLMVMDLRNGKQQFPEIAALKPKEIVGTMHVDNKYGRLSVFYKTAGYRKTGILNLVFLNADGSLSEPYILNENSGYIISDGSVLWISENAFILAGAYKTDRFDERASGFYFAKWENHQQQLVTYYSFDQFNDYNGYARADERKDAVKSFNPSAATNYMENYIAFHPVYRNGSGYRLIGEVYYPEYIYDIHPATPSKKVLELKNATIYKGNNRYVSADFQGFRYTHTAILDLDENGDKVKDYCFPENLGMIAEENRDYVKVLGDAQNAAKMVYVQRNKGLFAQEIIGDQIQMVFIDGLAENVDSMGQRTHNIHCVYWYGNNYLVYGYKRIKSKSEELSSVFFIKRMSFSH